MLFYSILLVVVAVIALLLAGVIVRFVHRIRRNETKNALSFFLPSLLTVLLILHTYYLLLPLFLDAPQLLAGNRELRSMTFTAYRFPWILEASGGERFFRDPTGPRPELHEPYLVAYGKNSRYIVEAGRLEENDADPDPVVGETLP